LKSRETKKYQEKGDMREKILAVSKQMFIDQGFDATSIRNIAKKLACSPGTIYLYFKNKDELLFAVHDEGFKLLHERMYTKMGIKDPILRLKALARAYIQFAWDYPEYYDLMFSRPAPMNVLEAGHEGSVDFEEALWTSAMSSFGCFQESIQYAIEQGALVEKEIEKVTFSLWASVHGMVSLCLCNRMKMFPEHNREELVLNSINLITDLFTDNKT